MFSNRLLARTRVASILKSLPRTIANLIRADLLLQQTPKVVWFNSLAIVPVEATTNSGIRSSILSFKYSSLGANVGKIYKRSDWPPPGYDVDRMFKDLWLIRNPALRAVRLKIAYKDVFSNERRFRFQLSASPNCEICGNIETVEHHLLLCNNASRIWDIYFRLTGQRITSLFELIYCGQSLEHEIVKSVLLKSLIQINRSRDSIDRTLIGECIFFLSIEARCNPSQSGLKCAIERYKTLV